MAGFSGYRTAWRRDIGRYRDRRGLARTVLCGGALSNERPYRDP
jgi:hypothetical protein